MSESLPDPETLTHYSAELNAILDAPLTPDNIWAYGSEALDQLVVLISRATEDYAARVPDTSGIVPNRLEDDTFQYFGLQAVGAVLDRLITVKEGLDAIDDVIGRSQVVDYAIAPSDISDTAIAPPEPDNATSMVSGEYAPQRPQSQRLKTVLFILQQDFGVDLHDPIQMTLLRGIVPEQTMRRESYYAVIAPSQERLILVCDEYAQATYVFDTTVLREQGLPHEEVLRMSKLELYDMLSASRSLGRRVIYKSHTFVSEMHSILETLGPSPAKHGLLAGVSPGYLRPRSVPIGENVISVNRYAAELRMNRKAVKKILDKLVAKGEVERPTICAFSETGGSVGEGLTETHRHAIMAVIEKLPPRVPDDLTISLKALVTRLGSTFHTLKTVYDQLVAEHVITEAVAYLFPNGLTVKGLSYEQQKAITERAERDHKLAPPAPPGTASFSGLAQALESYQTAVEQVYLDLVEAGTITEKAAYYKFGTRGSRPALGVSLDTQRLIAAELFERTTKQRTREKIIAFLASQAISGVTYSEKQTEA